MTLTRLLIKCYGKEFYKMNAGFLIISFTVIIGYGLFIKTAGHIPQGQERTINFVLLLQFLQAPAITLMAGALWLVYTFKCWRYVWKMSIREEQLFWRYSATAIPLWQQFISWFIFQLYLFIPLLFYWFVATIFGLVSQLYEVSFFSGIYLLGLACISTGLYIYRINYYPYDKEQRSRLPSLKNWPKPLFSLFLYELLSYRKLSLLLTKSISLLLIISFYQLFRDVDQITRITAIIALCIIAAHALLAYQDGLFAERHLYFILQLPYHRRQIYLHRHFTYLLLLLPELLWFLYAFCFTTALLLVSLTLSGILFIRAIPEIMGLHMRTFLQWVFGSFFISMILLLYNAGWYIVAANTIWTVFSFFYTYYRKEAIAIK